MTIKDSIPLDLRRIIPAKDYLGNTEFLIEFFSYYIESSNLANTSASFNSSSLTYLDNINKYFSFLSGRLLLISANLGFPFATPSKKNNYKSWGGLYNKTMHYKTFDLFHLLFNNEHSKCC